MNILNTIIIIIFFIVFPAKWLYSFNYDMVNRHMHKKAFNDSFNLIDEKISSIYISKFQNYSNWITFEEEVKLIKKAFSSPYSKIYLREVSLNVENIKDAIDILDILSDWMNIESVSIQFLDDYNPDIVDSKEAITEAKNRFYKKAGIIYTLLIEKAFIY